MVVEWSRICLRDGTTDGGGARGAGIDFNLFLGNCASCMEELFTFDALNGFGSSIKFISAECTVGGDCIT